MGASSAARPSPWLADKGHYYLLTLALVAASLIVLVRLLYAPLGYAMRAGRDSPLRADAIGIDVMRVHWLALYSLGPGR